MNQTIEVILDDQDRILIPSALRRRLGLTTGTTLVVEDDDQGDARLSVQGSEPLLVDEAGILVVTSQLSENFDFDSFIQQEREARIQKFVEQAGS